MDSAEGVKEGQPVMDKPIFARPRALAAAVAVALGAEPPQPVVVGKKRVRLRWMRLRKNGELIPR